MKLEIFYFRDEFGICKSPLTLTFKMTLVANRSKLNIKHNIRLKAKQVFIQIYQFVYKYRQVKFF